MPYGRQRIGILRQSYIIWERYIGEKERGIHILGKRAKLNIQGKRTKSGGRKR